MKKILSFLPHVNIIISVMMITFYLIDRVNPAMAFINNDITKTILFIFSILVICTSIYLIYYQRKEFKEKN